MDPSAYLYRRIQITFSSLLQDFNERKLFHVLITKHLNVTAFSLTECFSASSYFPSVNQYEMQYYEDQKLAYVSYPEAR